MRTQHVAHALPAFPVYSIGFLADDKLALGGGGGASKSGIKNKIRLYTVTAAALTLLDELELEPGEDAPMTMAVNSTTSEIICGINSAHEKLVAGDNQNCRVYGTADNKIERKQTTSTLTISGQDVDDYQKVTTFSPSGELLAVGCTDNQISLLTFPSLSRLAQPFNIPRTGGDIYDIDFFNEYVIITCSKAIYIASIPSTSTSEKAPPLKVVKTIEPSSILAVPAETTCSFRSARVVTTKEKDDTRSTLLYTVVNTTPPRSAPRGTPRSAYVCTYQLVGTADDLVCTLAKSKSVSSKAITVFDISSSGQLLAVGSSDLSVMILDAKTLAPLLSILKAHELPPTALRFNASSSLLVSGSADNSVRVISVPATLGASGASMTTAIYVLLLSLLAAVIAVFVLQQLR
ncbi:hypothetical protein FRB96_000172 [Tulasnella sp. 330]|nr:hypothetical protein FRB96_000172 [Tulasnella sp. 330]KAG8885903.1 hypothetical protein FRB97_009065 [Tulasnella sp. 331]KAG8891075.1 hypothetical protein FRB98_000084 [Tulasnella sp. 332]